MNKKEIIKLAVSQLIGVGNLDVIEKIFSARYTAHAGGKNYKGHEFLKRFEKKLRSAIPDVRVLKVEFLNEAGNIMTWQRTLTGTHKENMMGIPASKKKIKWTEMIVTRFENDKIAEEWVVSELMGELLLKVPAKKIWLQIFNS